MINVSVILQQNKIETDNLSYYYYVVLRRIDSFGHLARKKYKNMWN